MMRVTPDQSRLRPGAVWIGCAIALCGSRGFGDRIIQRDLTIIDNCTVASFDEDGARLSDDRVITWDTIEQGTLDEAKQADFDKLLDDLGLPLFRIRKRLEVGDDAGALAYAEAMYPRYEQRQSRTAFMVFQALMWARIKTGQRELAVEPYLRSYEYLRATRDLKRKLPGNRDFHFNGPTAMTSLLQPVWFNKEAAKSALEGVRTAAYAMAEPRPEGVYIYYATLALTAGETDKAMQMLNLVKEKIEAIDALDEKTEAKIRAILELRDIALAQGEILQGEPGEAVAALEQSLDGLLLQNRPPAIYWLGVAKLGAADENEQREGVLQLLRLPALYGTYTELAGAGLYQSMQTLSQLKDKAGSDSLRRELLVRYATTVHAAKVKNERGKASGGR